MLSNYILFGKALVTLVQWLWPWPSGEEVMSSNRDIGGVLTTIVHPSIVGSNDFVVNSPYGNLGFSQGRNIRRILRLPKGCSSSSSTILKKKIWQIFFPLISPTSFSVAQWHSIPILQKKLKKK